MDLLERERTAERLLVASARHTIDPDAAIDWDAPPLPDAPWMSWRTVSLYGTPLWDRMTPQQRQDLSRHEVASLAGTGIWLERVLMLMLLRHAGKEDPRSAHVRYALTEIADECRHTMMFGHLIERLGTPAYSPDRLTRALGGVLSATAIGTEIFATALIGEEILDAWQRQSMADEAVQPLTRQVDRVHVVEEARHVGYARGELARQWATLGTAQRALVRVNVAGAVSTLVRAYVHPGCYAAVGLDPREARRVVRASGHRRETLRAAGAKLTAGFVDLGIIGGPSRAVWRRTGLL